MGLPFDIAIEWLPRQNGAAAEDALADCRIFLDGANLTANINVFHDGRNDSAVLAPYPLAMWFAANWWRLRWEATPARPDLDWRMSHLLLNAGHGFCWPAIGFQADGEDVYISFMPRNGATSSVVYLSGPKSSMVPRESFEGAVLPFIERAGRDLGAPDLEAALADIREAAADEELETYRRIEAILGFDVGSAPFEAISPIMAKAGEWGQGSTLELAALLYGQDLAFKEIDSLRRGDAGLQAKIEGIEPLRRMAQERRLGRRPWEIGYEMAREARKAWGIEGVCQDGKLAEILSVQKGPLFAGTTTRKFGMAVRHDDDSLSLAINKLAHTSIRFMAARLIGDAIFSPAGERVLSATEAKTARQKAQRAFAAEMLCPLQAILEGTDGGARTDDDALELVAREYGVSSRLVATQLVNDGRLPHEETAALWFGPERTAA